jgi:hypothetical protein
MVVQAASIDLATWAVAGTVLGCWRDSRWRSLLLLYSQRYAALRRVGEALQDKTGGRAKSQRNNWRPFEKAREYARGLGFKSEKEWQQWARTDACPADIPVRPSQVYKEEWRVMAGEDTISGFLYGSEPGPVHLERVAE